jgi:hypothetical protein
MKTAKLLIAAGIIAALATGTAACGSSSSVPAASVQTSEQAAGPGCTAVDVSDNVALTAAGNGDQAWCQYFTSGEFTQGESAAPGPWPLNGTWVDGSLPTGSLAICSGPAQSPQGSTLPSGTLQTLYDTTGQQPGLGAIGSLCAILGLPAVNG